MFVALCLLCCLAQVRDRVRGYFARGRASRSALGLPEFHRELDFAALERLVTCSAKVTKHVARVKMPISGLTWNEDYLVSWNTCDIQITKYSFSGQ